MTKTGVPTLDTRKERVDTKPAKQGASPVAPGSVAVGLGLTMAWQLFVVVLVPILLGVIGDKQFGTSPVLVIVGFGLGILGTIVVVRRAVKDMNRYMGVGNDK